jgi:hypothetical protein
MVDLINFYNKERIDTSRIHTQEDLNKAIQGQTIEKKNKYNPNQKGTTLQFTCVIREQRYGLSTKQKQSSNQATGVIYDDGFEFNKKRSNA